jgi:shikimate 5-dehydrogenase
VKRLPDGGLYGDMFDGVGFVRAAQRAGFVVAGARCLVVNATPLGMQPDHPLPPAPDADRRQRLACRSFRDQFSLPFAPPTLNRPAPSRAMATAVKK